MKVWVLTQDLPNGMDQGAGLMIQSFVANSDGNPEY